MVTQPQHGADLVDSSDEELDESSASPSEGTAAAPPGGGTGRSSAWRWVAQEAGSGRLQLLGCSCCCGVHIPSHYHSICRELTFHLDISATTQVAFPPGQTRSSTRPDKSLRASRKQHVL